VIARILGEGQFDVPDRYLAELDTQDEALNEAVVSGDQVAFPGSGMSLAQVTALLSRTDLAPVHIRAPAPVRG